MDGEGALRLQLLVAATTLRPKEGTLEKHSWLQEVNVKSRQIQCTSYCLTGVPVRKLLLYGNIFVKG